MDVTNEDDWRQAMDAAGRWRLDHQYLVDLRPGGQRSFGGRTASYHPDAIGAVRLFTKSAAIQYAKEGIRVNSVHPGFVDSPMTERFHALPEIRSKRVETTPLGRMGTPEDPSAEGPSGSFTWRPTSLPSSPAASW